MIESDTNRMQRMQRLNCILVVTVVLACGRESPADGWQAQRDVLGDTTTVHTLAGQIWPPEVDMVEDLTIGVLDGPEEFIFGNVSRLAEDGEGGIYVLDAHGPVIRHFDRAGAFLGMVGGPGEGPGEYGHLSLGMVVDSAGTLYMHDWGNGRIVRFSADGQALDPWPLQSSFLTTALGTWLYSEGPGRILLRTRIGDAPALLRIADGRVVDTLSVPPLPGVPPLRGGPYRVESYWAWNRAGHFVVGVSNEYSLEARLPRRVLRIRRDVPLSPVHPEEADAWRRQFEWMERHPSYNPPEGEWIPSHMPPFRALDVAADGRIWVRRNTDPIRIEVEEQPDRPPPVGWTQPFLFDVFEADGSFLGQLRFPDEVEPHIFGSQHVWGVRRGHLDEQYVVRLRLRGPDGASQ